MKSLGAYGFLTFAIGCMATAGAATLNVGSSQTYKRVQDAINVAVNGDTILVDPGTYVGYAGVMLFDGPSNITVKASSGRPVIDMGPDHSVSVWGKGCINITSKSSNITIDGLEIKNAAVRDLPPWNDSGHNGAGIRWDGAGMLRVLNCVIHDCEDGILGTTTMGGDFLMENTVMYNNGSTQATSGTHNVYLGSEGGINSATVQYCWAYNAKVAHSLKISAKTIKILYNRLGDEIIDGTTNPPTTGGGNGNAIDLPHGGLAYVMGNLIIKGFSASDGNVVRYGEEGLWGGSNQMYVMYNTFIGQRTRGNNNFLVIAASSLPVYWANNAYLHYNPYDPPYAGPVRETFSWTNSNVLIYEHQGSPSPDPGMINYSGGPAPYTASALDVHLTSTSPYANAAVLPGTNGLPSAGLDNFSLIPARQYIHPAGALVNAVHAVLPSFADRNSATDVGMYNFNNPAGNQAPFVTAGGSIPPKISNGFTNRPIATVNGCLMGSASDTGAMTYTWSKVSGPGTVTFTNPNALVTQVNFSAGGIYTLELAANDGVSLGTAQCTVQAEQAPLLTVNGTDFTVGVGQTVHLIGTATDGDGPVALTVPGSANWAETYRDNLDPASAGYATTWSPNTGGAPSSLTENVSFSKVGAYLVRLGAWDGLLYSFKTVKITVSAMQNQAPVVTMGTVPAFAYEGWTVNLSATAVDLDGDPMTYAWAQSGGKSVTISGAANLAMSFVVPSVTLTADGPLNFNFTATDNNKVPPLSGNGAASVNVYMMGDISHDGYVNVGDLQQIVAAWNQSGSGLPADLNHDSLVSVNDLQALVANWARKLN